MSIMFDEIDLIRVNNLITYYSLVEEEYRLEQMYFVMAMVKKLCKDQQI